MEKGKALLYLYLLRVSFLLLSRIFASLASGPGGRFAHYRGIKRGEEEDDR